ncbi:rhodanese-like domain-containing protein [Microbacterium sp. 77mftsu3.1]|uniref:rhodanese-like domain-containing protein n=1 Tax=Microbacterium sp. 77mftsu3.1 TaxID=1761802 RepID=UPI00037BFABB|nr:rhodanese-like domain-containing protein [Microbacterium sp. 77mftsu3.1]SDG99697.1 Rhodanese-related sulfurtransferase [Microbacterium sp. 77mftsu3.1]
MIPSPASVLSYFETRLHVETDPSDVYASQRAGDAFVLVDVRDTDAWDQGHASGAIHIPHGQIASRAASEIAQHIPVVVYCWSPGCNGGARGAVEFARLGYAVREMIGGFEYWAREGLPVEGLEGPLPRRFDPLVMPVRPPR